MSAYTPAPWRLDGTTTTDSLDVISSRARVALLDCEAMTPEMVEANARLIASAPELADALRDAEFLLRKLGQLAGPMQDSCQRCASDARALLARVDGDVA